MQAEYNVVSDKLRVKVDNTWKEVSLTRVKTDSPNDPQPELTDAQENQRDYEQKLFSLQQAIENAKQKAELFNLGIETQTNLDKKIKEYKAAKSNYDEAKTKLGK